MYPILLDYGSLVIPAWHTFFLIGAIAAYFTLIKSAKYLAPSISEKDLNGIYICAYLGGYFGARLLSVFIDEIHVKGFVDSIAALFRLGPMTFYGGAIGSVLCASIYVWIRKLPLPNIFDIAIPAGLVGLALGRIGCFLNGDDYGKPVPFDGEPPWWAVVFPNLKDGVARYPVQLVSTVVCLILAFLLLRYAKKLRSNFGAGATGIIGTAAYANFRFAIEFFRGDPRGSVFGGLFSTSQFISLMVLAVLLVIAGFMWLRRPAAP